MKSVKDGQIKTGKDIFPHLGIYDTGNIVLFHAPRSGIIIHVGKGTLGLYEKVFSDDYELFTGSITLSND